MSRKRRRMVRKKRKFRVFLLKILLLIFVISLPVAAYFFWNSERDKMAEGVRLFMSSLEEKDLSVVFSESSLADEEELRAFAALLKGGIFTFSEVATSSLTGIGRGRASVSLEYGDDRYVVDFQLSRKNKRWLVSELPPLSVYQGAFVVRETGERLTVFHNGAEKSYFVDRLLDFQFGDMIFLIAYGERVLLGKPLEGTLLSRVLTVKDEAIEGEEEGFFNVAEEVFTVYLADNDLKSVSSITAEDIIPGYRDVKLYLEDDKVFAAVLMADKKPADIRVVINDSTMDNIYHPLVRLSGSVELKMVDFDNIAGDYSFPAGTMVTLEHSEDGIIVRRGWGEEALTVKRRVSFSPIADDGRIALTGILREGWGWQTPHYRGKLDISYHEDGLILINELPLESYLHSVVSGETAFDDHEDFSKIQAIISRSYAYLGIIGGKYRGYGAHLDDSRTSQAYNRSPDRESAVKAVNDTRGLVPFYDDEPVRALYFPVSCGYTANAEDVWTLGDTGKFPGEKIPYLRAVSQISGEEDFFYPEDDESMAVFLERIPEGAYDAGSPYFRWQINLSRQDMEAAIKNNFPVYYDTNPHHLLSLKDNDFVSLPLIEEESAEDSEGENSEEAENDFLGDLLDIQVIERGAGGIVKVLEVRGSNGVFRVLGEDGLRRVLRPVQYRTGFSPPSLRRNDGSWASNIAMLPSAFINFEFDKDEEEIINSITIKGGGMGHGVGLSQYGARKMVGEGQNYVEVIAHYYPGTQLKSIY